MSAGRKTVLSLYRQLLRLHQRLPTDMKTLGTLFVQDEFKKHKDVSDDHAKTFIKEWMVSKLLHLHYVKSLG